MFTIKIDTGELANAIILLAEALKGQQAVVGETATVVVEDKPAKKVVKVEELVKEVATKVEEQVKAETPAVDLVTIRKLGTALARGGKNEQVKAILEKFKAINFTSLDKSVYADVYKELEAI